MASEISVGLTATLHCRLGGPTVQQTDRGTAGDGGFLLEVQNRHFRPGPDRLTLKKKSKETWTFSNTVGSW